MDKTSYSHPLRIDNVVPVTGVGVIGMSFCPGKKVTGAFSGGNWFRDLELDMSEIRAWGANIVLTLLESWEFKDMQVEGLGTAVHNFGIEWRWLEIQDGGIPEGKVLERWQPIKSELIDRLQRGERVFVHCRGGLGRTGTLTAEILVELGEPLDIAMQRIRAARPGTIETQAQEDYLEKIHAVASMRRLVKPGSPAGST